MYETFDESPAFEGLSPEEEEPEEDDSNEPDVEADMADLQLTEPDFEDMEVTWSLWAEEPGFDQMYQAAEDWLSIQDVGFFDRYKIMPVNISD